MTTVRSQYAEEFRTCFSINGKSLTKAQDILTGTDCLLGVSTLGQKNHQGRRFESVMTSYKAMPFRERNVLIQDEDTRFDLAIQGAGEPDALRQQARDRGVNWEREHREQLRGCKVFFYSDVLTGGKTDEIQALHICFLLFAAQINTLYASRSDDARLLQNAIRGTAGVYLLQHEKNGLLKIERAEAEGYAIQCVLEKCAVTLAVALLTKAKYFGCPGKPSAALQACCKQFLDKSIDESAPSSLLNLFRIKVKLQKGVDKKQALTVPLVVPPEVVGIQDGTVRPARECASAPSSEENAQQVARAVNYAVFNYITQRETVGDPLQQAQLNVLARFVCTCNTLVINSASTLSSYSSLGMFGHSTLVPVTEGKAAELVSTALAPNFDSQKKG